MKLVGLLLFSLWSIHSHAVTIKFSDGFLLDNAKLSHREIVDLVNSRVSSEQWFLWDRKHHVFYLPEFYDYWDFSNCDEVSVVVKEDFHVLFPHKKRVDDFRTNKVLLDLGFSQMALWVSYNRFGDWHNRNRIVIESLETMIRQVTEMIGDFVTPEYQSQNTIATKEKPLPFAPWHVGCHDVDEKPPLTFVMALREIERAIKSVKENQRDYRLSPKHAALCAFWLYAHFQFNYQENVRSYLRTLYYEKPERFFLMTGADIVKNFGGTMVFFNKPYRTCVPIFTKRGIVGLNTAIFGTVHGVVPVAFSLNPQSVHVGYFRDDPLKTTEHDYHHASGLGNLNLFGLGSAVLKKNAVNYATGVLDLNQVTYKYDDKTEFLRDFCDLRKFQEIYYGLFDTIHDDTIKTRCVFCLWFLIHEACAYLPFESKQYDQAVHELVRKKIIKDPSTKLSENWVVNELFFTFDLMKLVTSLFKADDFTELIYRVHKMISNERAGTASTGTDVQEKGFHEDDVIKKNQRLSEMMAEYFHGFYRELYSRYPLVAQ